jgi:hypothetical protein
MELRPYDRTSLEREKSYGILGEVNAGISASPAPRYLLPAMDRNKCVQGLQARQGRQGSTV